MEIGHSQEDYLEAIYCMNQEGKVVKGVDLAVRLKRSKPSVSVALQTLEKKGYIEKREHGILYLTEKGRALAERLNERHQLFKAFFLQLGLSPEVAEQDACSIEHVLSEACYQKLKEVMASF